MIGRRKSKRGPRLISPPITGAPKLTKGPPPKAPLSPPCEPAALLPKSPKLQTNLGTTPYNILYFTLSYNLVVYSCSRVSSSSSPFSSSSSSSHPYLFRFRFRFRFRSLFLFLDTYRLPPNAGRDTLCIPSTAHPHSFSAPVPIRTNRELDAPLHANHTRLSWRTHVILSRPRLNLQSNTSKVFHKRLSICAATSFQKHWAAQTLLLSLHKLHFVSFISRHSLKIGSPIRSLQKTSLSHAAGWPYRQVAYHRTSTADGNVLAATSSEPNTQSVPYSGYCQDSRLRA